MSKSLLSPTCTCWTTANFNSSFLIGVAALHGSFFTFLHLRIFQPRAFHDAILVSMTEAVALPATMRNECPQSSPADSERTVVAASSTTPVQTIMSQSGGALFSTEFGMRPPRNVPGPPFPSIIVRSQKVIGVVEAAKYWRERFPWQSWCIFPNCGWKIEDFWDARDIEIDTHEHYEEVLKFLSHDNLFCAWKFAREFSRTHPEQVAKTVGQGNLDGIYDPAHPEFIVDKVFVNGETKDKPRQFLWHAAHIMRAQMVDIREREKSATASHERKPSVVLPEDKLAVAANVSNPAGNSLEPLIVDGSAGQVTKASAKIPRKKNRNQTRSRPQRLTNLSGPGSTAKHQNSPIGTSAAPPDPRPLPAKPAPSHGSSQPSHHRSQPMGHVMGGAQPQQSTMGSPSMGAPPLQYGKNRHGQGAFHSAQSGSFGENLARGSSGAYTSRPPSGSTSGANLPHFNAANIPVAQFPGMPHPMHLLGQVPPPMPPNAYNAPPHLAGMIQPMPPQPMHISGQNVTGYVQPGPTNRISRGPSFGDVTNNSHYASGVPAHCLEGYAQGGGPHRHIVFGNNNPHGNGAGALFDPYNGTKPGFNDYNVARKASRSGYMDQPGRGRRSSGADNRPRTGNSTFGRTDNAPPYGDRFPDYRTTRIRAVEDSNITRNHDSGCNHAWIGPENNTVDELFVSDLPVGIRPDEVCSIFKDYLNIVPKHATVRANNSGKPSHAFVQ